MQKGYPANMKWNKLYKYPTSTRSLIEGNRHYDVSNEILPSVTTILQATQSDEKKAKVNLMQYHQKLQQLKKYLLVLVKGSLIKKKF